MVGYYPSPTSFDKEPKNIKIQQNTELWDEKY